MRTPASILAALLAAVLVWSGSVLPAPMVAARADDAETGTTITVGLVVAVVAAYGLVSLRNDIEDYASTQEAIDRATAVADASPLVIDSVLERSAFGDGAQEDGVMVGWRLRF